MNIENIQNHREKRIHTIDYQDYSQVNSIQISRNPIPSNTEEFKQEPALNSLKKNAISLNTEN